MAKLTKMDRDDLQSLLETHGILSAIKEKLGKRGISAGVTTTNSYDDSDFETVTIDTATAKQVIAQQIAAVEKQLAGYGISVK